MRPALALLLAVPVLEWPTLVRAAHQAAAMVAVTARYCLVHLLPVHQENDPEGCHAVPAWRVRQGTQALVWQSIYFMKE